MNKKDYLLSVLSKLENDRLPAWGFKIIIEEWKISEEIMDILIEVIQLSLKESDSIEMKSKLEGSLDILDKVKSMEAESKEHDKEDIQALEEMLEQL